MGGAGRRQRPHKARLKTALKVTETPPPPGHLGRACRRSWARWRRHWTRITQNGGDASPQPEHPGGSRLRRGSRWRGRKRRDEGGHLPAFPMAWPSLRPPGAAPPRTPWVTGGRGTWGPGTAAPGRSALPREVTLEVEPKEGEGGRWKSPGGREGKSLPPPPARIPPRPQLST